MASLLQRLQITRQDATQTRIALRHAKNEAEDFLTWFNSSVDYTALGKNEPARKLALAELLAKNERAHKYEAALRDAEDVDDIAQCALDCVLDERYLASDQTWATLAEYYRDRTGKRMNNRGQAGQEVLKEQVENEIEDESPF